MRLAFLSRIALLALLLASPARADDIAEDGDWAEIEGVRFSESAFTPDGLLRLQGIGLLRYRVVFKGYVAALYLPDEVSPTRALDDVPKRLELEYFWAIEGADFGPAAEQILARSLSVDQLSTLRSRLDSLHGAYRNVEPGDRYALTYTPGRGTELALNGEAIATVDGADFASAYFSIWLGREPLDEGLRDDLLGRGVTAAGG